MKKNLVSGLAILMVSVAFVGAAEACSRTPVSGGNRIIQPSKRINSSLLDAAVRVEVNYHRCRAGLGSLRSESRLRKMATGHSKWMSKARNMTHVSTLSGRRTLADRIRRSGLRWKATAENIGMVHRFRIEQGRFFVNDAASCQFTNAGGQQLPPHTYQSLARYIVDLWMASPGHRHNILDRRMKMVGTAISLDAKAQFCGAFYITQDFAQ